MKKFSTILLFTNFLIYQFTNQLISQADFFGYFETEADQMRSRGIDYSFGYNKVRLDLEVSSLEEAIFRTNLNYQLYHGQQEWDLFDFLPDHVTDTLMSAGVDEFPFPLQDTLYLDNAYLKVSFPTFDFTIGKQQLSLGTGYAWNPLDIFNRKQLLDPTYEQIGVNAIRFEMPVAERFLVDMIVSPKEDWNSSARLIRGKVGLGRFDITGTVGAYEWTQTGFDIDTLASPPFQFTVNRETRRMIGAATVGEVFEWGVWCEGSWIMVEGNREFPEYLIGMDHTFDFSTYLLVEYYHNGGGVLEQDSLQLGDYFSYFSGESHSLMQDYLFVFVNQPVTDLFMIGMFGIANFNDKSAIISPQVEYSLFENVNLSFLISSALGDVNSEFGLQDWSVRLRLRTYF